MKDLMQDVFNTVWNTLKARDWKRAVGEDPRDGSEVCCYRSPIGPCAIGIFLSDEVANEYEGKSVEFEDYKIVKGTILEPLLSTRDGRVFITEIQEEHDEPSKFGLAPLEQRYRNLAREYGLKVPEQEETNVRYECDLH